MQIAISVVFDTFILKNRIDNGIYAAITRFSALWLLFIITKRSVNQKLF